MTIPSAVSATPDTPVFVFFPARANHLARQGSLVEVSVQCQFRMTRMTLNPWPLEFFQMAMFWEKTHESSIENISQPQQPNKKTQ